ncbi:hypothetical protein RN001_007097 [Aquatica leii]|uniref:Uncharacterized protein n=1 Tax=Aquatica leii TaxID=1421715 RepID=A0AAN7PB74_9COLE|nr:hypothetical protein RN001_007097 [Aquatica leii]
MNFRKTLFVSILAICILQCAAQGNAGTLNNACLFANVAVLGTICKGQCSIGIAWGAYCTDGSICCLFGR